MLLLRCFKRPSPSFSPIFTRLDLVVVIAIGATSLSLLFPLVLQARQAAQGAKSLDNLRRIGTAVMAFENARGHLPYGTFHDKESPGGSCDPRYHMFYSGWTALLPFIDETELFEHYNPMLPYRDETDLVESTSSGNSPRRLR